MKTIFREMTDHVGQVREGEAQAEIERLNNQGKKTWGKDYSPYLADDDESNPEASKLLDGYCWIVTV